MHVRGFANTSTLGYKSLLVLWTFFFVIEVSEAGNKCGDVSHRPRDGKMNAIYPTELQALLSSFRTWSTCPTSPGWPFDFFCTDGNMFLCTDLFFIVFVLLPLWFPHLQNLGYSSHKLFRIRDFTRRQVWLRTFQRGGNP